MTPVDRQRSEHVTQAQHSEVLGLLHKLAERLTRMEERLRHHYENEHADFETAKQDIETILDWARGSRFAMKLLGVMAGVAAGAAAAYAWVNGHFHITPK
jgi:hypothetical protein